MGFDRRRRSGNVRFQYGTAARKENNVRQAVRSERYRRPSAKRETNGAGRVGATEATLIADRGCKGLEPYRQKVRPVLFLHALVADQGCPGPGTQGSACRGFAWGFCRGAGKGTTGSGASRSEEWIAGGQVTRRRASVHARQQVARARAARSACYSAPGPIAGGEAKPGAEQRA